jgi:glutathione S-transferase
MTARTPIRLHQFPPAWGRNISPFALKLETWLRLAGIAYEVVEVRNPSQGPKGTVPFIEEGGQAIGDSGLIIEQLSRTRGIDLDAGLDPAALADALAFRRLLEDHLRFILVWSRWVDPEGWRSFRRGIFGFLPPGPRQIVPGIIRRRMRGRLIGQGIGRHSREEIYALGRADLEAVSVLLGDGPFFFLDRPTTFDAIAYGFLANVLLVPIETELKRIGLGFANLSAFCQAMERRLAERPAAAPAADARAATG